MSDTKGWTIFGCIMAVTVGISVLVGIHLTYKGVESLAKQGLQECVDFGSSYPLWQRECRNTKGRAE